MRHLLLLKLLVAAIACDMFSQLCIADDGGEQAQLVELGERFASHEEDWNVAFNALDHPADSEISDEEWLEFYRKLQVTHPTADAAILPQILEFAKRNQTAPIAFDALAFVIIRGGSSNVDVNTEQWRAKEAAIELVQDHHMHDERIVGVLDALGGCLPSDKSEAFLRASVQNPDKRTRAAACLALARYLYTAHRAHERSIKLRAKEKTEGFERMWKLIVSPYLEKQVNFDAEACSREVEQLLVRVVDEFSDVPASKRKREGPSGVFFQVEDFPARKSYGDLARLELFELKRLVAGSKAPEIEGVDADGKTFRLSDYRGKVVLLSFSANWCAPCVQSYPMNRRLVEKFRLEPFVMLSVNCDKKLETLKKSRDSGQITWRCWWDGLDGPIHAAWNSPGRPTIFLLDKEHIIRDAGLTKQSSQKDYERAISKLLSAPGDSVNRDGYEFEDG